MDAIIQSKFAVFYRKRIKKHRLLRSVVLIAMRIFFKTNGYLSKKKYKLIKQNIYAQLTGARLEVAPSYKTCNPRPSIFPSRAIEELGIKSYYKYEMPPAYISVIEDALVFAGTGIIVKDLNAIYSDSINIKKEIVFEEYRCYTRFCWDYQFASWFLPTKWALEIPEAASFTDTASANFAHWLTEILPKIVLFCSQPQFKDVPLILNDGLPASILESARVAAGPERRLYLLSSRYSVKVGRLHLTSSVGYAPAGSRGKRGNNFVEGHFNGHALRQMRHVMHTAAADFPHCGERLYLRRQSSMRSLLNNDEIEKILEEQGFTSIDTGQMSFLEQVAAMAGARWIVAPGGAALANLMFCKPDTNVVVLAAAKRENAYFYWDNMARPFDVKVSFVLGASKDHDIHADYQINPADLLDALSQR